MTPSTTPSAPITRSTVQALRNQPTTQVLIIGGGINGVGTFRDLALQGIDVALVERGDFCEGASGASSHMIHGGIRYLENGEFRLVQESVAERNRLLRIAPHYVKPLRTTIPVFSTFSGILNAPLRFLRHGSGKPQERGAVLIKAGLTMYDTFSRGSLFRKSAAAVPWHEFHGATKSLAALPQLRGDVKYTATYFDASVHNPERLTLDVLRDGLEANAEARAANYVSAIGHDDRGVILRDELTGEIFTMKAALVINTTGAWTDLTNESLGVASQFMGGTKGSHIVLDSPALHDATAGREIFFEHTDGRIVLIYPIGDRVMVGTTDIDADMSSEAVCTDAEIDYFFELVAHVFPTVPITRDQIVYSFSGVRPLPHHDDTAPGFVSRDYRIESTPLGGSAAGKTTGSTPMLSLVGGKWTTFRALSAHLTDEALAVLGRRRIVDTADLVIGGGNGFPTGINGTGTEADWIAAHTTDRVDAARATALLERYGTRADAVIRYLAEHPDAPLENLPASELSTAELRYLAEHEQLGHLVDVVIRRTALAFRGQVTGALLREIATAIAPELGWTAADIDTEVAHAIDILGRRHRVALTDPATAK